MLFRDAFSTEYEVPEVPGKYFHELIAAGGFLLKGLRFGRTRYSSERYLLRLDLGCARIYVYHFGSTVRPCFHEVATLLHPN